MSIEYLEFKPVGQDAKQRGVILDGMRLRQGVWSSFGQATSSNIDA